MPVLTCMLLLLNLLLLRLPTAIMSPTVAILCAKILLQSNLWSSTYNAWPRRVTTHKCCCLYVLCMHSAFCMQVSLFGQWASPWGTGVHLDQPAGIEGLPHESSRQLCSIQTILLLFGWSSLGPTAEGATANSKIALPAKVLQQSPLQKGSKSQQTKLSCTNQTVLCQAYHDESMTCQQDTGWGITHRTVRCTCGHALRSAVYVRGFVKPCQAPSELPYIAPAP